MRKKTFFNAFSTIVQAIVLGLVYFLLYRFLLSKISIKQLGVWSLVVSISSVASLANFGITSGLVKFVADYLIKEKSNELHRLIFTAFISVTSFYALLIFGAYFIICIVIRHTIDTVNLQLALSMLPFSLVCLLLIEMSSVFLSVLDGFQKNYIKSIIFMLATVIFYILSVYFVPYFGLMGVIYAQLIQSILILLVSLYFGIRYVPLLVSFHWHWDKAVFKSLISYGLRFQLVGLLSLLYDPIIKILLGKFGGLAIVVYYEMGSRLVNQVRGLITNANQVIIPIIANAAETGTNEVVKIYKRTLSLIFIISVPAMSALIIFATFVSIFWIGHSEPDFVFAVTVLALANLINLLAGPAYFSSLGEGKLNLLVIVHLLIAFLNIGFGAVLGYFFGGKGVIAGWALSLGAGSLMLIFTFQKRKAIQVMDVFSKRELPVCICFLLAAAMILFPNKIIASYSFKNFVISGFLFAVIIVPLLIINADLKAFLNLKKNT